MPRLPPADAALDRDLLRAWPLPANDDDDKRGRGTALIIGGSEQTPGAVLLAGTAALRVGAGKLQLATAGPTATAVAVAMPEALVLPIERERALAEQIERVDAVVVGPGLLDLRLAARLLDMTLASAPDGAVVVIDAGAISHLPKVRRRSGFAGDIVITPNREELTGLVPGGRPNVPGARERQAASELNVTVVSFGCVAAPDGRCWLDGSLVRGLGTSGAGDVLAGAVGGLGARCHDGPQAACWAGLVHRLAGHRLATARAPIGYLARELVDELSSTLAWLDPAGGAG
jgi:ADP-dependent NAD(P)H-hydrate dehydratase